MFVYPKRYDVIVVGGGHAGIEASLASARMGCSTLLLTTNADTIGQMSCNPAIGGSAKGHLVREIDALGGEMGQNTDLTGIQFRMLNRSRGPAVWSPRAQCDKKAYQLRMKWICEKQFNLDVKQGQAVSVEANDQVVLGVTTSIGVYYQAEVVILTTGTFLQGLLHIGANKQAGGRSGESASVGLSDSLRKLGLQLGRLKTGTPPRLSRRTIDFSALEEQSGDEPPPYFSYWNSELFHMEQHPDQESSSGFFLPGSALAIHNQQVSCYLTRTTTGTKQIIQDNLHLSPLYSGEISGIGPRYCPSIEDKIVRFSEKDTHQVFLEPEGIQTDEIYVNGLSTSLPFEVQCNLVRTLIGCEKSEVVRPAYAVEYDFVFPTQLLPSLETKICQNLFLAGQINGTSGYEEAAAQGIMAGINAARRIRKLPPIILGREQAYIGVMLDDLVTLGTNEPYRMFTSRSEYRLLLRQDNADFRLSSIGHEIGLLSERRHQIFLEKKALVDNEIQRLETTCSGSHTLAQILRQPDLRYRSLASADLSLSEVLQHSIETEIKYSGYIERQNIQVAKIKSLEGKQIPSAFNYNSVVGLSTEGRQKLLVHRPVSVGQASRISGVTKADISLIVVWLKRWAGKSSCAVENTESSDAAF